MVLTTNREVSAPEFQTRSAFFTEPGEKAHVYAYTKPWKPKEWQRGEYEDSSWVEKIITFPVKFVQFLYYLFIPNAAAALANTVIISIALLLANTASTYTDITNISVEGFNLNAATFFSTLLLAYASASLALPDTLDDRIKFLSPNSNRYTWRRLFYGRKYKPGEPATEFFQGQFQPATRNSYFWYDKDALLHLNVENGTMMMKIQLGENLKQKIDVKPDDKYFVLNIGPYVAVPRTWFGDNTNLPPIILQFQDNSFLIVHGDSFEGSEHRKKFFNHL